MIEAIANRSSTPPQIVGSYVKHTAAYAIMMVFTIGHSLLITVSISINTAQARIVLGYILSILLIVYLCCKERQNSCQRTTKTI